MSEADTTVDFIHDPSENGGQCSEVALQQQTEANLCSINNLSLSQPHETVQSTEIFDKEEESLTKRRLDELSEKQLSTFAENCWLMSLLDSGVPVREALRRVGIDRSERSVRNLRRRYLEKGKHGLFDTRWFRVTQALVLTSPVKRIILALWFAWPAAGPRAIWKELKKECQQRGMAAPGESAVFKFLTSQPAIYKMFREGKTGIRRWEQTAAPVVRFENTKFSNQRWQGDHSPLNVWVRVKDKGVWKPMRAYISALLDVHPRSIPGFIVSTKYPDSWTIALLFFRAIRPKQNPRWKNRGYPLIFQSDRGKDFLSNAVAATLGGLKVILDPDPPRYPNRKGKVERWFETLDSGCLRTLPGHMDAVGVTAGAAAKIVHELLTTQQLTAEIERWIVEDYHQRPHSETGRKPADLWEETVRLMEPELEDLIALMLKKDVERTVINIGIRVTIDNIKHAYYSPELIYEFGRRVSIAYNPEDLESVYVYCAASGKYLCEAFDLQAENPRFTVADLREFRSRTRRGMRQRIQDYLTEIETEDRRAARKTEWEEARQKALEAQQALIIEEAVGSEPEDTEQDVTRMLEQFRRRDRGEE